MTNRNMVCVYGQHKKTGKDVFALVTDLVVLVRGICGRERGGNVVERAVVGVSSGFGTVGRFARNRAVVDYLSSIGSFDCSGSSLGDESPSHSVGGLKSVTVVMVDPVSGYFLGALCITFIGCLLNASSIC